MPDVTKIDLKKEQKDLYRPSKKPHIIDVPAMQFLMVDGEGNPNTAPVYADAVSALYAASYTLKFASKKEHARDYVVMPLEGLWWADDMAAFAPETADKDTWKWTMMIRQPDHITAEMVASAVEQTRQKKDPPRLLGDLRFETYHEGLAVQVMYVGPYADEGPTIAAMHRYAEDEGYALDGLHHEIYLSDPRRTAPEKLKTIIRQPVAPR